MVHFLPSREDPFVKFPSPSRLVGLAGRFVGFAGFVFAVAANVMAEPANSPDDQQMRFFENRIRPLLVAKCYECHAGENVEGGLRFDVADTITKGGDSGVAIMPGKPDASLLVSAIRYEDLEMPPEAPLSVEEQADIVKWIELGAYWPISSEEKDHASADAAGPWWAAEPIDPGLVPRKGSAADQVP